MSSGQFIVPATIVRFVAGGPPLRRLEDVMRVKWDDAEKTNPFAVVDALYTHILNRSPDPQLAVKWIGCLTSLQSRKLGGGTKPAPALFWKHFLEDTEGELHYLLMPLTSLLSIPPAGDRHAPITFYHKSLTDFLSSKIRSGELYASPDIWTPFAADRCVKVLKNKGPTIPLYPGYTLTRFIAKFLSLCPLVIPDYLGMNSQRLDAFAEFLQHLSVNSRDDLASCDVAWWTRRFLRERSREARALWYDSGDRTLIRYLGGIYCRIHLNLCGSGSLSSACHPACSHWRKGILDESQVQGWCGHELEKMDIADVAGLTKGEFLQRFKKVDAKIGSVSPRCEICQHTVSNAGGAEDEPDADDGDWSRSGSASVSSISSRSHRKTPSEPSDSSGAQS
ncbi:hypothetical protein NMY22_g20080 [Coprinellus aureogranulatus]|nr:hypothetical protein NMY22_g20080 [Coprinellus aureogranulatus]